MSGVFVAGRGEATTANRKRFTQPAIVAVRYADPASWTTASAIDEALGSARAAVLAEGDRVGLVVTSAEGPIEAMAAMHEATKERASSPIRFPASNAGSLTGIPAIAFGLRGPTLMLTLPADRGASVALILAEGWLAREVAAYVIVAACRQIPGEKPAARALLLGRSGDPFDQAREIAWLASPASPSEPSEAGAAR